MAGLCEYSDSSHSLFYSRNSFRKDEKWLPVLYKLIYTRPFTPFLCYSCMPAHSLISYISPCWQGCLHCCLRLLDCLSLPWNLRLLPYFVGSLNDIHFQLQCQHQRYVLASCRHTALMFWLILTSTLLSRFLKHAITSLLWKILRVCSVTRTVEERQ